MTACKLCKYRKRKPSTDMSSAYDICMKGASFQEVFDYRSGKMKREKSYEEVTCFFKNKGDCADFESREGIITKMLKLFRDGKNT